MSTPDVVAFGEYVCPCGYYRVRVEPGNSMTLSAVCPTCGMTAEIISEPIERT